MENIKAFLDTDILLNFLCKEIASNGKGLWEAPYKILKRAEQGKIILYTALINLIAGFNLQSLYMLDPFDAIYLGVASKISSFLISRDRDFISIANVIKGERVAFDPEAFLDFIGDKT